MAKIQDLAALGAPVALLLYSMETTHLERIFSREHLMDMHIRNHSSKSTGTTEFNRTARDEAESRLRDIAYVLHLTRRVREEILAEKQPIAISQVCRA